MKQHAIDNPYLDIQCNRCKDGTVGTLYIEIFRSDAISEANAKNPQLPKFGFHLGAVCVKCGRFIKHLKQNSQIVGKKFILIPE